jgi:hypothetical protein
MDLARRRDSFASALTSLRLRALRGEFTPGQTVIVIEEARRLRVSPTPIREALACLCGEGLFERSPSEGFLYPRLDVALIRDRLKFRLKLLLISLEAPAAGSVRPVPVAHGAPVTVLPQHLAKTVRAEGNVALYEAYRRVAGQLAPLRQAERRVLGDVEGEASNLLALFAAGDVAACSEAVTAYHRRRADAAPRLLLDVEGEPIVSPGKG